MITTILVFFFVLSVLILVHEGGHFLAAKKAKIKVEEFGFGYPPRILAKKIGKTIYSLNLIPFGGFVKLFGEEIGERSCLPAGRQAFWQKSKKARTAVILAGVLANFLLAIVCFSTVYSFSGIPTPTDKVKIIGLALGSPAEKSGLKVDDVILSLDEKRITELTEFTKLIEGKKGKLIKLIIARQKEKLVFSLTPRVSPPEGEGAIGVVVSNIEMKKYPFYQMPFRATVLGLKEAIGWGSLIFSALGKMIIELGQGIVPKDVAGPIGIFQITANVSHDGFLAILQLMGILSVNLTIINVLPFPALDGGKLSFVIYEVVTRRRPKPKIEHWANAVGMAILLFLLLLVTINDINRLLGVTDLLSRLRIPWPF